MNGSGPEWVRVLVLLKGNAVDVNAMLIVLQLLRYALSATSGGH